MGINLALPFHFAFEREMGYMFEREMGYMFEPGGGGWLAGEGRWLWGDVM